MLTASTQLHLMFGAIQNFLAFFTLGAHRIRRVTEEIGKTGVRLTVMMPLTGISSTFVISSDIAVQSKISDAHTPIMGSVETFTLTNCTN